MRNAKYKLEHRKNMKAFRAGISRRPKGFAGYEYEGITAFLLNLFNTKHTRMLLLTAALLAFAGCRPAPEAPSFEITETAAPVVDSPDDRPQFPDTPTKPVSVPAKVPEQAASYEQCTGPGCGEQRQPVRKVLSKVPGIRRLGR